MKNLTEIVFILDRSGSMAGLESDTIGGFNAMLTKQKNAEGDALVSTILFDHDTKVVHDRLPIQEVLPMDSSTYQVRGSTALLDAIGGSIRHVTKVHHYIRKEDIPEHTIFIITTDGMENASHKYTSDQVKKMIQEKEKLGWKFIFLGANIDAVETAENIGIKADRAVNYHADACGTALNFESVSAAISSFRADGAIDQKWRKKIDEDYKERSKR